MPPETIPGGGAMPAAGGGNGARGCSRGCSTFGGPSEARLQVDLDFLFGHLLLTEELQNGTAGWTSRAQNLAGRPQLCQRVDIT